ncbi:hypothetical protein D910_04858 [Dendroctonus ponderosae]|uniref:Laminin IV type A domain-containing protein n=1 Tax=Dendroctonus ponderosae TaxID=77166 RepID=U4UA55_DENPD|nr:hypothetical protein D910_04858 [Dendroctonus ponderosae]
MSTISVFSISSGTSSMFFSIGVQSQDDECVYFVAPDRFLGDQRSSYNQLLEFSLRIGDNRAMPAATDIILESNGNRITNTIFAQDNGSPTIQSRIFKFRLHEHPDFQWQPRLNSRDFISILTNLTAIKIRGTYCPKGVGFLDDVKLETAARGAAGSPALWLEFCECPQVQVAGIFSGGLLNAAIASEDAKPLELA